MGDIGNLTDVWTRLTIRLIFAVWQLTMVIFRYNRVILRDSNRKDIQTSRSIIADRAFWLTIPLTWNQEYHKLAGINCVSIRIGKHLDESIWRQTQKNSTNLRGRAQITTEGLINQIR
jgi:hypothetical protein